MREQQLTAGRPLLPLIHVRPARTASHTAIAAPAQLGLESGWW
ncbi:MAG TPA: hypothetical protein VGP36_19495 [Mycobacteriales bacterium]|jgi:hypothetical protein|nr:hypothetical protein [Mycobacteriales bacterium]